MNALDFSQKGIEELKTLMDSPVFDQVRRADHAKRWRNEVEADWIGNFMNRMQNGSVEAPDANLVNDKTGKTHTVESMVETLRDRVKLDTLEKEAQQPSDLFDEPTMADEEVDTEERLLPDDITTKLEKFLNENPEIKDAIFDEPTVEAPMPDMTDKEPDTEEESDMEEGRLLPDDITTKLEKFLNENPEVKNALKGLLGDPTDQMEHTPLEEEVDPMLLSASMIVSAAKPEHKQHLVTEPRKAALPLSKKMVIETNSKKKDPELGHEIDQFINDHFSSHRGGIDDMAVIWALREKYGADVLRDYTSFVSEKIQEARHRHPSSDMKFVLPSPFMGMPMKSDPQGDTSQPMFENIKNM